MPDEAFCNQKRDAILKEASKIAAGGAHYLWGAEGLKPTSANRKLYADVNLDLNQPDQATFCAATRLDGTTAYVCAGRCLHPGLAGSKPNPKFVGAPAGDANLKTFIGKYAAQPNTQYNWGFDLTPRVIRGKNVMDYSGGGKGVDVTDRLVWGEGCDDTLHFDCAGFVRWIVRQVCHSSIAGISGDPENANGKTLGHLVEEGDTVLPADILLYPGHIGFAIGAPAQPYSKVTRYALAQAECATLGVTYGTVHKQDNIKCIRLTEETLRGHPATA